MESKINQWLSNLSSRFGQKKWQLNNFQCCLNDGDGIPYLTMEWLPNDNLLLLAFPLGNLESEGLNAEEKMFELLSLNSHSELVGKAWIAIGEGRRDYYLMSTINIASSNYNDFEQQWLEINDLSKLIQFAITSKMPLMNENIVEQSVRV